MEKTRISLWMSAKPPSSSSSSSTTSAPEPSKSMSVGNFGSSSRKLFQDTVYCLYANLICTCRHEEVEIVGKNSKHINDVHGALDKVTFLWWTRKPGQQILFTESPDSARWKVAKYTLAGTQLWTRICRLPLSGPAWDTVAWALAWWPRPSPPWRWPQRGWRCSRSSGPPSTSLASLSNPIGKSGTWQTCQYQSPLGPLFWKCLPR